MDRDMMKLYVVDLFGAASAAARCSDSPCEKCMKQLRHVVDKIDLAIANSIKAAKP